MNQINLYGPPNTLNFVEATRYFISRCDLTLNVTEWNDASEVPTNVFQDESMKVVPILVVGEGEEEKFAAMAFGESKLASSEELSAQDESVRAHFGRPPKIASHFKYLAGENDLRVKGSFSVQLKQEYTPKSEDPECPTHEATPGEVPPLRKRTRPTQPLDSVVCYACHANDIPGKFDVQMADALGVPVKSRSVLVKGLPLTLDNGKVIQPSDCISPSTPGRIMLVVHVPNSAICNNLLRHPAFLAYQRDGAYANQVAVVIHMTNPSSIYQSAYQNWMRSFKDEVQHIVINKDHCARPIVFDSSAANQLRLNTLHPYVFRPVSESRVPFSPIPEVTGSSGAQLKIVPATPLLKFHLSPIASVGLDSSELSKPLDLNEVMAPFQESVHPVFAANRKELTKHWFDHQTRLVSRPVVESHQANPFYVVFLGTGAALPSKYRNVSSTYVVLNDGRAFNGGSFLLDAGEGTYGQLTRHYVDQAQVNTHIRQLKCIFISHMHADHHLGVIRMLTKRNELMGPSAPPLLIVAPPHFKNWISEYDTVEKLNYTLYSTYDLVYPVPMTGVGSASSPERKVLSQALRQLLGFSEVNMVPVIHCPDAFGVTLTHNTGWKLVFSGDTRPCSLLDKAGADCDLLIHEATFEDQLTHEAVEKNHATTTEAIQSALHMNAKFLMMTHFSQRYPKIPVFDHRYTSTTGIAFDLMKVTFDDLPILPHLLPCLKDFFDEVEKGHSGDAEEATSSAPPAKKPKKK